MMLMNFLYMMLMTAFPVVPVLYKSRRLAMIAFYDRMVWRYSMRRMYSLTIFLFLITFHFYYLTLYKNHYEVIASTALCYSLVNHRWFERIIRTMQSRRMMAVSMTMVLALLFVPHCLPMAVTIAVVMMAAVYYPSRLCTDKIWMQDERMWEGYNEKLENRYFAWSLDELRGQVLQDSETNSTTETDGDESD